MEAVDRAGGKVIEAQAILDKAQEEADAAHQLVVNLEQEFVEATGAVALAFNPPSVTDPETVAVRALPLASAIMVSIHDLEGMDETLARQVREKVNQALCAQGIKASQAHVDDRASELFGNQPVTQSVRPPRRSASAPARGRSVSGPPSENGRSGGGTTSREPLWKAA